MPKAIVMGGGFGGIAASLRLRAKGYDTTIIDRCSRLGGRAQVFEKDGFRHDAGPTVITAPFMFDELFSLFGRNRADYIQFAPVEPWYRFQFADGETFDYGGTTEDTCREIARLSPGDDEGYRKLLSKSRDIFEVGFKQLSDQPFDSFSTMLAQVPNLVKLGCHKTVWQMVRIHLKDERLQRAFSIQPLLVGGNPLDTTCIYSLIHYLEREWGIHFAMGGTGALVSALERLMREVGIRIRTGTTVDRVLVENGAACGIALESGETVKADIVISNVDPMHLYSRLLDSSHQSRWAQMKRKRAKLSMGLFVLFFGTRKQYPDVAHHTIWMGDRFEGLLKDIFKATHLPDDFSLYLHRPTATDPSFAPSGCDSFYVLAPVPNLKANIDWKTEGPRLQKRIVDALDKTLLPDLKKNITSDFFMTPKDFAHDYLSAEGAGFSVAPVFSQSAWFRFHNKAEGPDNLYLVGAGTHPGAGLPGVLSSAKVMDKLVPAAEVTHAEKGAA